MKAITTRLRRLERAVPPEDPEKLAQLDAILQGLKEAREARGEPFEEIDYTGCYTIEDMILAGFKRPGRERAKNAAVSGNVGT
jgi:hypothetical protein